jgi:hypothetical protein
LSQIIFAITQFGLYSMACEPIGAGDFAGAKKPEFAQH